MDATTTIGLRQLDSDKAEDSIQDTTDADPLLLPDSYSSSQPTLYLGGHLSHLEHLKSRARTLRRRITTKIALLIGFTILALLLIASGVTRSPEAHPAHGSIPIDFKHWRGFDKIENYFAFGDSWTSIEYQSNGAQPNEQNPLGNPAWPGQPTSLGPNYIGYLTALYNQSFIKTWDLAYAGSVVDANNDPAWLGTSDFAHQLKERFIKGHTLEDNSGFHSSKGWASNNTLFIIFFGINDVIVLDEDHPHLDKTYVSYENFTEQLYNVGARNFVVINVPPLEYAPSIQRGLEKKRLSISGEVKQFNDMLAKLIGNLRSRHGDINIFDFDLHDLFSRMVQNSATFRQTAIYKNITCECDRYALGADYMAQPTMQQIEACGGLEVQEYLWRDGLHVTYPVHKLMAAAIARMLTSNGTEFL